MKTVSERRESRLPRSRRHWIFVQYDLFLLVFGIFLRALRSTQLYPFLYEAFFCVLKTNLFHGGGKSITVTFKQPKYFIIYYLY